MYYTNITDTELQLFRGLMVPNFTIKLTDALTSGLFKVETIITDKLYKIYPLFYTESISTDNEADTVIDDLCIICTKQEDKETYITCISDENEPVQDYQNYASYYDIGDQLTTAEYNAIISMLRHSVTHNDEIRIADTVNGVYADYYFDIEGATILDTGILVTSETILAEPKVKLRSNVFKHSTYTLKLSVLHYTGVNIFDGDTTDYKVVDTLEVELTPYEWVDIPVTDIEEGYIISFDAEVEINHDKPVIQGDFDDILSITSDKMALDVGEVATLTIKFTDWEGYPYVDTDIILYENGTPLDEALKTDIDGICTYEYTGTGLSNKTFYACYNGEVQSNSITIVDTTTPVVTTVALESSASSITVGESVTLTAYVKDQFDTAMEGETVTFYDGETSLGTGTTNSSGIATLTASSLSVGSHSLKAVCSGVNSSSVIVIVNSALTPTTLNVTATKDILSYADTESSVLTATVLDQNGNAMSGQSVVFKNGSTVLDTVTTDANGESDYTYASQGVGDVTLTVECSLLQETYTIEDCVKYDETEYTKSFSSTRTETIYSTSDLTDCSISLDLKSTTYDYSCVYGKGYNSESDQIGYGTTNQSYGRIYRTLNGTNNHSNYYSFNSNNVYYNLKFEKVGNTLKLYLNDNLIDTSTDNAISNLKYLNFISWRSKTIYYKNLKIKPL